MAAGVVAISGTLAMLISDQRRARHLRAVSPTSTSAKLLIGGIIPGDLRDDDDYGDVWILVWLDPSARRAWSGPCSLVRAVQRALAWSGRWSSCSRSSPGRSISGIATRPRRPRSALSARSAWRAAKGKSTGPRFTSHCRTPAGTCMIIIDPRLRPYLRLLLHPDAGDPEHRRWVGALDVSRWVILTLILFGYIVLGSFMDQIAILVLTVPIVLPLIIRSASIRSGSA